LKEDCMQEVTIDNYTAKVSLVLNNTSNLYSVRNLTNVKN